MVRGQPGGLEPQGKQPVPPPLCIGLPVYNGDRFLEETLESILSQTYRDFELIVSDNASTDGTQDIVARFAQRDERVRYVRHEQNMGASANFDSVQRLCRSPYFKWAACDDTNSPHFLQRCVDILDSNPDIGLVYSRTDFIGADSLTTHGFDDVVDMSHDWSPDPCARARQYIGAVLQDGSTANVIVFGVIRSEVLNRTEYIGRYFGADQVLVAQLVLAGGVREIPETMSFLRRHGGSSSTYDRTPEAKSQQDFYDPSVRGVVRLQWNLRRRYPELLRAMATAPVQPMQRVELVGSLLGAVGRRLLWRIKFERNLRSGSGPPEHAWAGGPTHWSEVDDTDRRCDR